MTEIYGKHMLAQHTYSVVCLPYCLRACNGFAASRSSYKIWWHDLRIYDYFCLLLCGNSLLSIKFAREIRMLLENVWQESASKSGELLLLTAFKYNISFLSVGELGAKSCLFHFMIPNLQKILSFQKLKLVTLQNSALYLANVVMLISFHILNSLYSFIIKVILSWNFVYCLYYPWSKHSQKCKLQ